MKQDIEEIIAMQAMFLPILPCILRRVQPCTGDVSGRTEELAEVGAITFIFLSTAVPQ